jgi:AraC-like DNA-binding protein
MRGGIPTYVEKGKIYYCDTCVPVAKAARSGTLQLESLVHGTYPGRPLPECALPEVRSIGFWNATIKQDWGLDWHRNEGIEFTLLANGGLPFAVGDRKYALQPDDLTITRPWQPHRLGDPTIGVNRLYFLILDVGVRRPHQEWRWPPWIVLRREDLDELTLMLRQNEQHVWKAAPPIRQCFAEIGQSVKGERPEMNISRLTLCINEFLLDLLEMFRSSSLPLNESLTSARRSVKMFIGDLQSSLMEPWTVRSMAEECGVGVTSFVYYFTQATNMTPMQYLVHQRVEAAAEMLLKRPHLHIIDVAMDCGFSSSQHFASSFKRFMGVTPTEHRRKSETGLSKAIIDFPAKVGS